MCVHICPALRMFLYPEREVCDKLEACAIAGSHRHTHTRTLPSSTVCLCAVLSRQEGNNRLTVPPVRLAASTLHFSVGHRQLLAR